MAGDLVDTTEMYLKAVYELEENGVPPMRARLVERLGQSKPTVSETVARLERAGLLNVGKDRIVRMTEEGRLQATAVMRKHRLAERLLLDVIGLPWTAVHGEACRWEHVMSDEVERRIGEMLGAEANTDPYGNPIPAHGTMGPAADTAEASGLVSIEDLLKSNPEGAPCTLMRIAEMVQVDEAFLAELEEAAMRPPSAILVRSGDGVVTMETAGSLPVDLPPWIRGQIMVRPEQDA